MTSKRPTPVKDEPVTPLDELQELLAANLAAVEALNRNLCGHSDAKLKRGQRVLWEEGEKCRPGAETGSDKGTSPDSRRSRGCYTAF